MIVFFCHGQSLNILDLIGQDPGPSPAIKPAVSNKVAKGDIIDLLGDLDLSPPSIQPGKC